MGLISYFVPKNEQQKPTINPSDESSVTKTNETPASLSHANSLGQNTPWTSRPASLAAGEELSDTSCELMAASLHQAQVVKTWYDNRSYDEGAVVKKSKGNYVCCPENLREEPDGFYRAVEALNVRVSL